MGITNSLSWDDPRREGGDRRGSIRLVQLQQEHDEKEAAKIPREKILKRKSRWYIKWYIKRREERRQNDRQD